MNVGYFYRNYTNHFCITVINFEQKNLKECLHGMARCLVDVWLDVWLFGCLVDVWLGVWLFGCLFGVRVPPVELNISAFPPVLRDWEIKGLGMSSLVYATGHIKDPVPLIAKRRGLSPGGRFPPSFIHQVIIITGLNKLYNCMFSP